MGYFLDRSNNPEYTLTFCVMCREKHQGGWGRLAIIETTLHSRDIHGPGIPGPCMSMVKPALSTHSDSTVAIATIDRPAIDRLKRHFGVFAALGAYGRKHLAWEPVVVTTTSIPLCLPCLAAWRTALGLISIALGLKELLFLSAEGEVSPTIGTLDRFVLKTHWMPSFLKNFSWGLGHPILDMNLTES